jgi:hypothetical protein
LVCCFVGFDPGTAACLKQATGAKGPLTTLPADPLSKCLHHRETPASMGPFRAGGHKPVEGEAAV